MMNGSIYSILLMFIHVYGHECCVNINSKLSSTQRTVFRFVEKLIIHDFVGMIIYGFPNGRHRFNIMDSMLLGRICIIYGPPPLLLSLQTFDCLTKQYFKMPN